MAEEITEEKFDFQKFSQWKKEKDNKDFYGASIRVYPKLGICDIVQTSKDENMDDLLKTLLVAVVSIIPKCVKYNQSTERAIKIFCHEMIDGKRMLGNFEGNNNLTVKK